MEVDISYLDYPMIIKTLRLDIEPGILVTFNPVEKEVVEDKEVKKYFVVDSEYTDENKAYSHKTEMSQDDIRIILSSLQRLQTQISNANTEGNTKPGTCCRKVYIK